MARRTFSRRHLTSGDWFGDASHPTPLNDVSPHRLQVAIDPCSVPQWSVTVKGLESQLGVRGRC